MQRYPWPGNVRELANIVERLSIMQPGAEVTTERVHEVLRPSESPESAATLRQWAFTDEGAKAEMKQSTGGADERVSLADALDAYERRLIERAIEAAHGNIAEAARRLHTDRPNLYRRMKRLGIGQPSETVVSGEPQ
jgi:DNA-binding NtrC family response regulator